MAPIGAKGGCMTTSPQWAPLAEPGAGSEVEFDLLVDESAPAGTAASTYRSDDDPSGVDADPGAAFDVAGNPQEPTGSTAAPATEYTAAAGTPGRGVILSTAIATAACAVLDLAVVGRLSFFFDVSFVVICLVAAMAVRPRDLFTAAVLPPLAFAAAIGGVAYFWPQAVLAGSSLGRTFLTGLAAHAYGLVGGYGAALVTVAARAYARRTQTRYP
jgi:uncharacterized protein DUF6542